MNKNLISIELFENKSIIFINISLEVNFCNIIHEFILIDLVILQ